MNIQTSTIANFESTFAHVVDPASATTYTSDRPTYVALYLGGHDGVRISLEVDDARAVAALLTQLAAYAEAGLDGEHRDVAQARAVAAGQQTEPTPVSA